MRLSDFDCPAHGLFEQMADSSADEVFCPSVDENGNACGLASPWRPSPVVGRMKLGEVSRGKSEGPPSKNYMDTRDLGDGMTMTEWRARRAKVHEERRHKSNKELL